MTRDENGKFVKGNGGGPGRPKKLREEKYHEILVSVVDPIAWAAICAKAVSQAKHGDGLARKWLADYLIGPPVQKNEHTGAEGGPVIVKVIYDKQP